MTNLPFEEESSIIPLGVDIIIVAMGQTSNEF